MGGVAASRYRVPLAIAGVCLPSWGLWTLLRLRQRHAHSPSLEDLPAPGASEAEKNRELSSSANSALQCEDESEITAEQRTWAAALLAATDRGHLGEVQQLIANPPSGAGECSLDIESDLPIYHLPSATAVFVAAMRGHVDVLEALLKAGADPNKLSTKATQWDGAFNVTEHDTALTIAARGPQGTGTEHAQGMAQSKACVEVLLRYNADCNVKCDCEYFEGAVEWGEDDDGTEYFYYSALDMAKDADIKRMLVEKGAFSITKLQGPQKVRPRVTQGSRMGA